MMVSLRLALTVTPTVILVTVSPAMVIPVTVNPAMVIPVTVNPAMVSLAMVSLVMVVVVQTLVALPALRSRLMVVFALAPTLRASRPSAVPAQVAQVLAKVRTVRNVPLGLTLSPAVVLVLHQPQTALFVLTEP
jgi:hypothetical protein